MSDFESVVAAAVASAGGSGEGEGETTPTNDDVLDTGDTGDGDDTPTPEGGDTGTGDAGDGDGDGISVTKPKTDDEPVDENDPLAKELGVKKGKDGKNNPIPYHRVVKIVPNLVAKELEPVAKVLGLDLSKVDSTKRGEAIGSAITETVQERDFLRNRVKAMDDIAPIMEKDGRRFIGVLANLFPEGGYTEFLAGKGGGAPSSEKKTPLAEDDPEPQPDRDIDLGNGVKGKVYSVEGHKKHTEWLRREMKRENEAMLNQRFAPLDKAQKAREEAQRELEDRENFVIELIKEAREWEGFKDHEKDIQASIAEFKNTPLKVAVRKAYEKVVLGKFRADYATIREQVLKELGKAPSTGAGGGSAPRREEPIRDADGNVDTSSEAIVRQAVQQMKNRGAK